MQKEINEVLNSNTTTLNNIEDVYELPSIMCEDEGGFIPFTLTFDIEFAQENSDDYNAQDLSKSRVWTKTGQSLGGKIIMGQSNDNGFVSNTGNLVPAYYDNNIITLNPEFYDRNASNYHGFGSTITYSGNIKTTTTYTGTESGVIIHEIGHDLFLNHDEGVYPEEGLMSPNGGPPTQDEINIINSSSNPNIIQPGKKH